MFPDTNTSRTVLDALLNEAVRLSIVIDADHRVTAVGNEDESFVVSFTRRADPSGTVRADPPGPPVERTLQGPRTVSCGRKQLAIVATGGRSLPKTGSDGAGYDLVRRLGHGYVETTPALAPLVLDGGSHARLAGVSHRAILGLRTNGRITTRLEGSLLWTHFGMSGPVVLNMSRHWHRAIARTCQRASYAALCLTAPMSTCS